MRKSLFIAAALALLVCLATRAGGPTIQESILAELKQVPRSGPFVRSSAEAMPELSDQQLSRYRADYASLDELKKHLAKMPGKHPLRSAALRTVEELQGTAKLTIVDVLRVLPAKADKFQKSRVLDEQRKVGLLLFQLEQQLQELEEAGENRSLEKSARWQAHYDYVRLACLARLVFLSEYNYALGSIRAERMPMLKDGQKGWRLAALEKVTIPETRVKQWSRQIDELAESIKRDHEGTPWSHFAERERKSPRGLEWRAGL